MTERYIDLDDTTLFVDDRGEPEAPALLYVHGGPGMGCWDFMQHQGDRLAESLRVIGVDQRGVLRSGPVGAEPLTSSRLVSDFEAVRAALGLESWTVLGHSAGGAYALDYALGHHDRVDAVVFDCPCWDADSTDRHRLPIAADLLEQHGHLDQAKQCRELASLTRRLTADDVTHSPVQALGEHYQDLFFHGVGQAARFDSDRATAIFGEESWRRGGSHAVLMREMYEVRTPLLARLTAPSLLMRGRHDLVTSPEMVARYDADVPGGRVHVFEYSGHFPAHEEPDAYARAVVDFVEEGRT